jgi:hypothetical protein
LGCPPEVILCPVCDLFWQDLAGEESLRVQTRLPLNHVGGLPANAAVSGRPNRILPIPAAAASHGARRAPMEVGYGRDNSITPMCSCGRAAKKGTNNKEGADKGREYYSCSLPYRDNARCKYFQYCDEAPQQQRGGNSSMISVEATANAICSHCKLRGHWARSCPTK